MRSNSLSFTTANGEARVRFLPVAPVFVFCLRGSMVEHSLGKGEVVSSILTGGTNFRTVSAAVEHVLDMDEVAGSNPARSTTKNREMAESA